jgi:hypothetical protein
VLLLAVAHAAVAVVVPPAPVTPAISAVRHALLQTLLCCRFVLMRNWNRNIGAREERGMDVPGCVPEHRWRRISIVVTGRLRALW